MADFTFAQISTIRGYVGSAPTAEGSKVPTDVQLNETATALETTSPLVVARHYLGLFLADLENKPPVWNLAGRYSENRTKQIDRYVAKLAELDALIDPDAGDRSDPARCAIPIERDDRDRLWELA